MTSAQPRVLVLGTGGTIAGSSAATTETAYAAGVVAVGDLVASVPGLDEIAALSYEQVEQLDSVEMTFARQLGLARRIQAAADRDDVQGIVVTHGTDTLEETSYLVDLVVATYKPIVFVGAMRPADAVGADGPANLRDAVIVAASPDAATLGALAVLDEQVFGARDVVKRHTMRPDSFSSAYPLGAVVDGRFTLRARQTTRYGAASAFDLSRIDELPPVETVWGRAGIPDELLDAYAAMARGLVYVGHGAGNIPADVAAKLADIAASGVPVVRTSRVPGPVVRGGSVSDDRYGLVSAGDLGPVKSRVLLALALTRTRDAAAIQEIFDTH